MKIKVTGDYRDVANSAWISTMKDVRSKSRTDEDAKRVVKFLVKHNHTSPFESVTITLSNSEGVRSDFDIYRQAHFSRQSRDSCTMDLLNFVKVTSEHDWFDMPPWELFSRERPELASMCEKFAPLGGKILTRDVSSELGKHGMCVELISFHDAGERKLSRATWRVKCPLSISVQILRHRMGSFNMCSGRYKTIRQEIIPAVDDCSEIFNKLDINLSKFLHNVNPIIVSYESMMKKANEAKSNNVITNDEYKRLREFARFILPEGRMTELYVTFYLDDFYDNYLPLRDSAHAQIEHIWIAQSMRKVLELEKG